MEGEPPQEEDFSQIPLVERSQHKVSGKTLCKQALEALHRFISWIDDLHCRRTGKLGYQRTTISSASLEKRHLTPTPSSDLTFLTDPYCALDLNVRGAELTRLNRKRWCLDANAVAQEKGIEAVLAIIQNSGESSARYVIPHWRSAELMRCIRTRIDVVPGIVEKALGNARAGTKKKGSELCVMYMEVENGGEGIVVRCRTRAWWMD